MCISTFAMEPVGILQMMQGKVKESLFAGVMSEHWHLATLINFKTMWQPQCASNSGLLAHQGAFSMFTM